jgi:dihydroorotate dehydrogenase/NAD-dependent dihydropyrimidine dehydrogenase PreA subunit
LEQLIINQQQRLAVELFGKTIPSPLILGSGTLVEHPEQIQPFLEAGAGAVVPRTTREIMERKVHPSPHLYQTGTKRNEVMLNAEWTGADINYWRGCLGEMSDTGQVVMSVSGRDIKGCFAVAKELDCYDFPYLEINISCAHSNSVHGFITRNSEHINKLVSTLKQGGIATPIAIKLGHSDFIVELADIAKEAGADAIVAINSFGPVFDFDIDESANPTSVLGIKGALGGMTGAELFHIALTDVARIKSELGMKVIACGGVRTAEHVIKMIMAGADAVQIYSAAHIRGINAPAVFTELNERLIRYLEKTGVENISELKGRALGLLTQETNLTPLVPEVLEHDCTGCDLCIPVCLPQAIDIKTFANQNNHVVEINSDCIGCGHCVSVCPVNALKINHGS